jgi:hypothetical protein
LAILNNEPLTYVSSDLNDSQALAPSHLLYGDRLTSLPYDSLPPDPSSKETSPKHGIEIIPPNRQLSVGLWPNFDLKESKRESSRLFSFVHQNDKMRFYLLRK